MGVFQKAKDYLLGKKEEEKKEALIGKEDLLINKNEDSKHYIKEYVVGEDSIEGMKNYDVKITEENVKDIFSFNTNRDLFFKDGSFIEKGTEFIIDQIQGDRVEVHFEEVTEGNKNIYNRNNEYGDGYYFTIDELKEFSNPSKEGIERYLELQRELGGNKDIFDFDKEELLKTLNNDISLSEKDFIRTNYEGFEKFVDLYIEDMKEYKQYQLDVYKEDAKTIGIQEYISHEMDLYNGKLDKKLEKDGLKNDNVLSYENEYKSVYEYPDCEVLKNKLNIKNANILEKVERSITTDRLVQLQEKPIVGKFDFKHLSKIHKYIFQDVYEWAGQPRKEEISKGGTSFAPSMFAVEGLKDSVFKPLRKENYLKGLDTMELTKKLAYFYCELNFAHPFREGNGRTQREFIKGLAARNGFELDWSKADPKELMENTILGTVGKEQEKALNKLAEIIKDCFTSLEPDKKLIKLWDKDLDRDR